MKDNALNFSDLELSGEMASLPAERGRFTGIERLYGSEGMARLRQSHVAVIGLGGVGSWCVEALARSGVGELTLVDLDDVCISNINRQLPALEGTLGMAKATVLCQRVGQIDSKCVTHPLLRFFAPGNADEILAGGYDFVVDAIDRMSLKTLLIAKCRERGLPIVTVGGAGGRRSATQIRTGDLSEVIRDKLLRQVRKKLRRDHDFPRKGPMGAEAVYSLEGVLSEGPGEGLRCDTGYGSASFVTGTFGFAAAEVVVNAIARGAGKTSPMPTAPATPSMKPAIRERS